MINKHILFQIIVLTQLIGCNDQSKEVAQLKSTTQIVKLPSLVDTPYIVDSGIKYPYFQYETYNHPSETNIDFGYVMFIYPIFKIKNKGLALDHSPKSNVRDLFGEELFGREFFVIQKSDILVIEGFPISRPLNMKLNSKWSMSYDKMIFECRAIRYEDNQFQVQCISSKANLSFTSSKTRGVTSFQDICSKGVCTYNLKSSLGLLSPYHLRVIGINEQQKAKNGYSAH